MRDVHGSYNSVNWPIVGVGVRVVVPIVNLHVPYTVGDAGRNIRVPVQIEANTDSSRLDNLNTLGRNIVHKVGFAHLDENARLVDTQAQQVFQTITVGEDPALQLLRGLLDQPIPIEFPSLVAVVD